jgi:hypothetical protein
MGALVVQKFDADGFPRLRVIAVRRIVSPRALSKHHPPTAALFLMLAFHTPKEAAAPCFSSPTTLAIGEVCWQDACDTTFGVKERIAAITRTDSANNLHNAALVFAPRAAPSCPRSADTCIVLIHIYLFIRGSNVLASFPSNTFEVDILYLL